MCDKISSYLDPGTQNHFKIPIFILKGVNSYALDLSFSGTFTSEKTRAEKLPLIPATSVDVQLLVQPGARVSSQ